MAIEMRFDAERGLGFADVEITRARGGSQRLALVERLFSRAAIRAALAAAGFEPVAEQPWAPFDGDLAGKTWWVARRA